MKKIEIIWREMLFQILEKGNNHFVQKDLAAKFSFSTSTIFQALKSLRQMGAVRVSGRDFILRDPDKLLYHWASIRNLSKDIIYQTKVNLPILELESQMPPEIIYGAFSAYRITFKDAPADYSQVWVYTKPESETLEEIKKRFTGQKGEPNLFVLQADPFLKDYGQITSMAQTFVDLWNLDLWYAKEFTNSLKEKIDGLLS
jgi:hypothetical protein